MTADNGALKSLFVLGRQPNLGLAELESVYGDQAVSFFNDNVATTLLAADKNGINRLGGTIKIAQVLQESALMNWKEVENHLRNKFVEQILNLPDGKIDFGISTYGISVTPREITNFSLSLKKLVKAGGRSIRIIPNQNSDLSSAQIIHNHLTGPSSFELIVAASKTKIIFARTIAVQNIYDYAARDQMRPKRDAKVGMLPPKLAQIMINLSQPEKNSKILDPFCGTGVILQEALLMGFVVEGSDIEPRMIEYSKINLEWLEKRSPKLPHWQIEVGDATTQQWSGTSRVVCETYLGRPLFKPLPNKELLLQSNDINKLVESFLTNLAPQIDHGTKLCLALPSWKVKDGFLSLALLDHLEEIGYNHMSFKTVDTRDLIYHRPDQLVARQLLVISRK